MADLTEFEQVRFGRRTRCQVHRAMDELPDDQAAKLRGALAADHITAGQIAVVLGQWGQDVRADAVRHARGHCRCEA